MTLLSESRLMVVAPHPDDETLACSVVLQRAVRAGAAVRIVYATDGDNNPWPQRVIERRWRIDSAGRKRWGALRRAETIAALRALGVDPSDAQFLGLPDQGLTNLLCTDCRFMVRRFSEIIFNWLPTHLLAPSIFDTHPDHNALAAALRLALSGIPQSSFSVWSYLVHGESRAFSAEAKPVSQSQAESDTKLEAILCHKSQLTLSGKRFLRYKDEPERFVKFEANAATAIDGAIRALTRNEDVLHLKIQLSRRLTCIGPTTLYLLGRDHEGAPRCLHTQLPGRSSKIHMRNCQSDFCASGRYQGDAFGGNLTIAVDNFSPAHPVFVKLKRRSLFFDEAGWLQTSPRRYKRYWNELAAVASSNHHQGLSSGEFWT